jgi:hypothetical protein
MDIRYFEFIERLKRSTGETTYTNASVTQLAEDQPFKLGVAGSIPVGGTSVRKVKMTFVVDKFDINQGIVTCSCGAQFDDWATYSHECPRCGVITNID